MKQKRYFHFGTKNGEVITIYALTFEKAEIKAIKDYQVIEYLGWTNSLEREEMKK